MLLALILDRSLRPGYYRAKGGQSLSIASLTAPEQSLLFAAVLAGPDGGGPLQRVHGPAGERCRRALEELAALSAARRRQVLTRLSRTLFAPLPSGFERVHPSWIEERLRGEPSALAAILLEGLPFALPGRPAAGAAPVPARSRRAPRADGRVPALLCRILLGDLPPLSSAAEEGPAELEALAGWNAERLERLLKRLGLLALAGCLDRAPELTAVLLARLPAEDARLLGEELHAGPPKLPWLSLPPLGRGPLQQLLPRLGAGLLGAGLSPHLRRRLAWLLPRPLGSTLLAASDRRRESPALLALVARASAAVLEEEQAT